MKNRTRDGTQARRGLRPIDWLFLAVLAASILFGVYLVRQRGQSAEPTVEILYTVCLRSVDTAQVGEGDFRKLIPDGASVTNETGTVKLGSVTDVTVRPHRSATVRDGEVVMTEVPDRVDLFVSVRAWATAKTGDGLRVSDIRIAAGRAGDFRIGSFYAGGGEVVAVERWGSE